MPPEDASTGMDLGPAALGLGVTCALHLVVAAIAAIHPTVWATWFGGFGLLQLVYVGPLAGVAASRGASRGFVVGVFCGAALAFVANAVEWAIRLGV